VICFEWLQRPENVLAGYVTWSGYRNKEHPKAIKILHHKTGAVVWHPLEETTYDRTVSFYEEAQTVLAKTPRLGVPPPEAKSPLSLARLDSCGRSSPNCEIHLSSIDVHARRMPARRHDRVGGGRIDRRSGPGAVRRSIKSL
jgi:hypothetical protein